PSSSRFNECNPRKFLEYGRCSSGYLTETFGLKKYEIVIFRPLMMEGIYIRSQKFIGFCSRTFLRLLIDGNSLIRSIAPPIKNKCLLLIPTARSARCWL